MKLIQYSIIYFTISITKKVFALFRLSEIKVVAPSLIAEKYKEQNDYLSQTNNVLLIIVYEMGSNFWSSICKIDEIFGNEKTEIEKCTESEEK